MKRYSLWATAADRFQPRKLEDFTFYWVACLVCLSFNRTSALNVAFVVPDSWQPRP